MFCVIFLLVLLAGCGTMLPPAAQPGAWRLEYRGECAGREAEPLQITRIDERAIAFTDFLLEADAQQVYRGRARYIAPMPADGRDIAYTIDYALQANEHGGFTGEQVVIESGGHGLACPVELVAARG